VKRGLGGGGKEKPTDGVEGIGWGPREKKKYQPLGVMCFQPKRSQHETTGTGAREEAEEASSVHWWWSKKVYRGLRTTPLVGETRSRGEEEGSQFSAFKGVAPMGGAGPRGSLNKWQTSHGLKRGRFSKKADTGEKKKRGREPIENSEKSRLNRKGAGGKTNEKGARSHWNRRV